MLCMLKTISYISLYPRGVSWGALGAAKGAPKNKKWKGKENREKRKKEEKKGGDKKEKR